MLSDEDRNDISAFLVDLKAVVDGNDANAIKEAIKRLEAASHKMAEAMYSEAADALGED